jgi:tetratricopeptide (TPR) repeat protein
MKANAILVLTLTAMVAVAPAVGQQNQQAAGKAQASASAAPAGKLPPQAKTQPEYDAYKAATANPTDAAAMEKAATDFAAKFPDSELRVLLYKAAMRDYQQANNADKMSEMARKVLSIDADDPEALIAVSEVLAERTRDTDLDKDDKWAEARKDAQRALQTIDTDITIPAGTPQDKVDEFKGFLKSSAYAVLGMVDFSQSKYADAEGNFRKSIDALPSQPDPVVVLRLAISLDKQGKYPEALKEANHAVELTQDNTSAGTLARRERDRLVQLTGGGATPAPAKPDTGNTQPSK